MKLTSLRTQTWIVILLWLGFLNAAQAGLKVYYLRHAEGGHNVVKEWKDKPKDQWPAYVGNAGMFTPKGEAQILKVAEKLKPYHFELIAVSPIWRTRNTILPYLKETNTKAELWPELAEVAHLTTNLFGTANLPRPSRNLFTGGSSIELPAEEKPFFIFSDDGHKCFKTGEGQLQAAADLRAIAQKEVDRIRTRFGGSEKSILLVGHGNAGRLLLHVLLKDGPEWRPELANTGIWMVEEQIDGSFKLRMFNDNPVAEPAFKGQ